MSNTAGSDRSQTAPRAGGRAQGTASPPTSGSPCSLAFLLFFFFSPCAHGHTKGWVIRDVILEINRVPSAAPAQAQMPHAVHDVGAVCPLSEARCCRSYKGLTHSSTPNPYVPHEMLRAKCPSASGPEPHSPAQRCSCLCGSCLLISSPPSPAGGFSSCWGPCWELVPAVLAQGSAAEPAPAPPAAPSPDKAAQTRPCLTRGPFPGRAAMPPVFPGWENITCSSQPLLFH